MKKIKKIVKSILFGLMALGCLLSSTLPAYAADIGCSVSYVNSFNEDGTPKSYVGYDPSNAFSFYAITFLGNSDGYHFLVGQLTDNLNDLTSLKTTTHFVDPKKDDVVLEKQYSARAITVLDFLKNTYNSQGTTGATLYDLSVTKILENPNYSNYTKEFIEKALSSYYFAVNYKNYGINIGDSKFEFSAQKKWSIMDFVFYLLNCYEKGIKPGEDQQDSDNPPKFYLKTHNDNGLNKYTEYTLTWLTKGSFVEGKESEYGFKVFIGKERKPLEAKELEATKYSPCKFTADKLVFTWENVKDLFSFLSTSSLENRFDVFIQITDKTGKAVSDNYIHFLVIKRVEIRESDYVDKNGNIINSYGKWENGQFKYTDGRDTSSEDNSTNSNGSSTAPGSNVSNDDYTDISNAPSSSQIDASATNSLIKTLDTIVSSVSNVPALLAKVYAWLPYQIITLIGTAIGLIVVVGIIKWVL